MKNFLKIKMVLLILVSAILFTACGPGKKEFTEADAQKYVESYFKASLTGDVDDYVEFTGETKEEVISQYQSSLESVESLMSGLTGTGEDFAGNFTEVCKKLMASTKYEIGEAEKDEEGNFTVEVKAYPSDVMNIYLNKTMQTAGDKGLEDAVIDSLNEAIENQSYGEAVSYQVAVTKNSEGKYAIDTADVNEVSIGLFAEVDSILQGSGKVFDNPYLNWTKTEWDEASEDEEVQCCLAVLQYVMDLTDEEMATLDVTNTEAQTSIQQMKEGINITFSSGTNMSLGDCAELIKSSMNFE